MCTLYRHLSIHAGTLADYHALKAFHYRGGSPVAVKRVFAFRYAGPDVGGFSAKSLTAGVLVESLPALACSLRSIALPGLFEVGDRSLAAAKLNRDLRTISRVIVHPIFRSAGLAVRLVKHALDHAETPYVEALAAMGRVHPFFKNAGMRQFDRPPLATHIRLLAALQRENLSPLALIDSAGLMLTPFLRGELLRFAQLPPKTSDSALLAFARTRLLSQPLYYIWRRPAD